MFTGIVKAVGRVEKVIPYQKELKIQICRPSHHAFLDLGIGDSVSVNGVCLTVEKLSKAHILFHLGKETLSITGWTPLILRNSLVNLEPALKVGDALGGHFVSGHIDAMAEWVAPSLSINAQSSQIMELKIPSAFQQFFWKKAFITVHGVSLTINACKKGSITMCLVPETLKQTNFLTLLKSNLPIKLTFEVDFFSRAFVSSLKNIKT